MTDKVIVMLSLGSNINAENNIREAVRRLETSFGSMRLSPVYKTPAVGFDGDDFLNLVSSFETSLSVSFISGQLKAIEDAMGRDRTSAKFSSRIIDIDLLIYDDLKLKQGKLELPRDEILKHAFVLKPLSDLHPEFTHPETGISYQEHWCQMQKTADALQEYPLNLRTRSTEN